MLAQFAGTLASGALLGGAAALAVRLSRGRLALWIVPLAAGLGMLAFVVSWDYSWRLRAAAGLPEGMVIARIETASRWERPWSHIRPVAQGLVAVDRAAARPLSSRRDLVRTTLRVVGRAGGSVDLPVVFDCSDHRRADLFEGGEITDDGRPVGLHWREVRAGDPVLRAACGAA